MNVRVCVLCAVQFVERSITVSQPHGFNLLECLFVSFHFGGCAIFFFTVAATAIAFEFNKHIASRAPEERE